MGTQKLLFIHKSVLCRETDGTQSVSGVKWVPSHGGTSLHILTTTKMEAKRGYS